MNGTATIGEYASFDSGFVERVNGIPLIDVLVLFGIDGIWVTGQYVEGGPDSMRIFSAD